MPKNAKPSTRSNQTQTRRSTSITPWLIAGGALFVLLIVLAVTLSTRNATPTIERPDVPAEWLSRTAIGDPNAPVTVEAYEDFLCPACAQWTTNVEPQLMQDYVIPGKVRFEYHQFPLTGHAPGAQLGAMASECAADQDAFWPYHDILFSTAHSRGQAGFQIDALVGYADDLGLNTSQFLQCMNGQEHRQTIEEAVNRAIALNLDATPSLLINGQRYPEPFDYAGIEAEIDRLLAASGSAAE